jgi:hypothetical protein
MNQPWSKYWKEPLPMGFPSCFWCKCPALMERLIPIIFAAEQSSIPECAKKVMPPGTLYVVQKFVCLSCGSRINEITEQWKISNN